MKIRSPWIRKRRKMYEIKVEQTVWGGHQTVLHLTEGWEPFGVSQSLDAPGQVFIWFRREVTT